MSGDGNWNLPGIAQAWWGGTPAQPPVANDTRMLTASDAMRDKVSENLARLASYFAMHPEEFVDYLKRVNLSYPWTQPMLDLSKSRSVTQENRPEGTPGRPAFLPLAAPGHTFGPPRPEPPRQTPPEEGYMPSELKPANENEPQNTD